MTTKNLIASVLLSLSCMVLSGFLMPLVPLLWVFSPKIWYLILIQIYGGFIWAGFEIASFNFIFDTTIPQQRATYVAHYNVLNGLAILLGGTLGGLFMMKNRFFTTMPTRGLVYNVVTFRKKPKN